MKQRDIFIIYEDPISKKYEESEAELLKKVKDNFDQECWQVKFCSDGFVAERWIAKNQSRLSHRIY